MSKEAAPNFRFQGKESCLTCKHFIIVGVYYCRKREFYHMCTATKCSCEHWETGSKNLLENTLCEN